MFSKRRFTVQLVVLVLIFFVGLKRDVRATPISKILKNHEINQLTPERRSLLCDVLDLLSYSKKHIATLIPTEKLKRLYCGNNNTTNLQFGNKKKCRNSFHNIKKKHKIQCKTKTENPNAITNKDFIKESRPNVITTVSNSTTKSPNSTENLYSTSSIVTEKPVTATEVKESDNAPDSTFTTEPSTLTTTPLSIVQSTTSSVVDQDSKKNNNTKENSFTTSSIVTEEPLIATEVVESDNAPDSTFTTEPSTLTTTPLIIESSSSSVVDRDAKNTNIKTENFFSTLSIFPTGATKTTQSPIIATKVLKPDNIVNDTYSTKSEQTRTTPLSIIEDDINSRIGNGNHEYDGTENSNLLYPITNATDEQSEVLITPKADLSSTTSYTNVTITTKEPVSVTVVAEPDNEADSTHAKKLKELFTTSLVTVKATAVSTTDEQSKATITPKDNMSSTTSSTNMTTTTEDSISDTKVTKHNNEPDSIFVPEVQVASTTPPALTFESAKLTEIKNAKNNTDSESTISPVIVSSTQGTVAIRNYPSATDVEKTNKQVGSTYIIQSNNVNSTITSTVVSNMNQRMGGETNDYKATENSVSFAVIPSHITDSKITNHSISDAYADTTDTSMVIENKTITKINNQSYNTSARIEISNTIALPTIGNNVRTTTQRGIVLTNATNGHTSTVLDETKENTGATEAATEVLVPDNLLTDTDDSTSDAQLQNLSSTFSTPIDVTHVTNNEKGDRKCILVEGVKVCTRKRLEDVTQKKYEY